MQKKLVDKLVEECTETNTEVKLAKIEAIIFFDDMVDIRNFYSNLLTINKKLHKDIGIYYIGYITIKKFSD